MSARRLLLVLASLVVACGGGGTGPDTGFNPTANTSLTGNVTYASVNIPAGVTVTVTGSLVLTVTGTASIAGTLTGDCTSIEIRVTGSLTVDGLIRNACTTAPSGQAPGIKLVADAYTIGTTASSQDVIVSDGSVRITDPATENEAFTPLPVAFGTTTSSGGSDVKVPFEPQHAGAAGAVNRPIRAGKGMSEDITKDGPLTVGALTVVDGDNAPALTQPGTCNNANNIGGTGGSVRLLALNSTLTINGNLKAGSGGKGGSCTAPSGCPASAIAGKGGDGGTILLGATTIAFGAGVSLIRGNGGVGGDATADADDGPAACANGCLATATAGKGGNSGGIGYIHNVPGGITGAPSETGADGGTGGVATAIGGNGRDCNLCPAGKGGDGGTANAIGGQGGDGATRSIFAMAAASHRKGNGGASVATGGNGGKGATCCLPVPLAGGNGGNGATATSTGGQIGAVGVGGNGTRGTDTGNGGNGANGGDGAPAGTGGAKGLGIGDALVIPDGIPGIPGGPCPSITIILPGGITIVIQGGTVTITIQVNRTSFTGALNIVVKDQNGVTRGQGTIPAGQNQGEVQISVPSNFGTGTFTWTATGSDTNVPPDTRTFQVQVNPPPGFSMTATPPTQAVTQGGNGSVQVQIVRQGSFTTDVAVTVRDHLGTIRGTGTIPAGQTSTTINLPVPSGFPTGTNTWTATGTATGVTTQNQNFQVTVNAPAAAPTHLRFGIVLPVQSGVVPPGNYTWNLLNAVGNIVGSFIVSAVGGSGTHFRGQSPDRIGWGSASSWIFRIGTAIVNGSPFRPRQFKICILNTTVNAGNPVNVQELDANDQVLVNHPVTSLSSLIGAPPETDFVSLVRSSGAAGLTSSAGCPAFFLHALTEAIRLTGTGAGAFADANGGEIDDDDDDDDD